MLTTEEYNDKPTGSNDGRTTQMTDLIPRDAAAAICDKHSYSNNLYVSKRMAEAAAEIRAIPAIDPAAIREDALYALAEIARGDGPLDEQAILALIGEKKC